MRFFNDVSEIAKHCANDASNDVHRPPLDLGGGDGRRRGVGLLSGALVAAASARAAWCTAARWLRRALARGPRRRCRRPVGEDGEEDTMGGAAVVPISSLILVLPVATDKVACPPALWTTFNKMVSSSPIFASESLKKCCQA